MCPFAGPAAAAASVKLLRIGAILAVAWPHVTFLEFFNYFI